MAELSEKKVILEVRISMSVCNQGLPCQIEGFKLHVTHNMRPFVNRVRYTPEVASRPDRLVKDLANMKILVGILENEAASLRHLKVVKDPTISVDSPDEANTTDSIAGIDADNDPDDPEPKESGSDGIERRVEKVLGDLRDQHLVDALNGKAYELKKVAFSLRVCVAL
jgi:hypothetical protein